MTTNTIFPIIIDDPLLLDPITGVGENLFYVLETAWSSVTEMLRDFAQSPDFAVKMELAFGQGVNVSSLQAAWAAGDFSMLPQIEVRSLSELNGANGAFAAALNTVYISHEFLTQNADNLDAIASLLLEELGHSADVVLNPTDSPGDEGYIFSALVRGETLTPQDLELLRAEDDTAIVTLDGQVVEIEKNTGETSLSFDGVDDYVEIAHDDSLSLTNFTVEAWVNPSQIKNDWQPLITKEASNGYERNYSLFIRPNEMRVHTSFVQNNGSTWRSVNSQNSLELNQWNHIAMTYDGSSFKFYLNGELDNSLDVVTTPYQNSRPVKIGKEISAYTPFSGKIDEVRIWNEAQTAEEIQANYAQQLTGNEAGLVGYWQFNEGEGNSVTDLSTNNNDGNILGDATFTSGVFSPETFFLPINNPSFENPALSNGGTTINSIPGWNINALTRVGIFDPLPNYYNHFAAPVPDGENTAYINSGSFSQVLSANLNPNT